MAKTKLVTFFGTGQRNGVVKINTTVEYEEHTARSFQGPNSDETITAALAVYYPGVKVNPRRIRITIAEPKQQRRTLTRERTKSSSTSLFAAPLWMFPFRLLWRVIVGLLKFIFNLVTKD